MTTAMQETENAYATSKIVLDTQLDAIRTRLDSERKTLGVTVARLAEVAHLPYDTVRHALSGYRPLQPWQAHSIETALHRIRAGLGEGAK